MSDGKSGAATVGVIGLVLILIAGVGLLFATGVIGGSSGSPDPGDLTSSEVALVVDVPGGAGSITRDEFDRSFKQTWKRTGLERAPKADDAQYDQIREAAINDLLDRAWLTGEAAELDIEASTREIDAELDTIKQDQFEDRATFQKFLKDSGFSDEDVRDRVRLQLLSTKVQQQVIGTSTKKESAAEKKKEKLARFVADYNTKWTARTVCAEGYVIPRCSNDETPENATGVTGEDAASGDPEQLGTNEE